MTTIHSIVAGNIIEAAVVFQPETGSVALADVTARLHKADGTDVTLTGITTPAANTFEVEWASSDTDITGRYTVRWESNTPSPKIVVEGVGLNPDGTEFCTVFNLIASRFATP